MSHPPQPPPQGPQGPYGYQQPYGYGYGGYPPPPPQGWWTPPPKIDPKQLKPSRVWYAIAGVAAAIGAILAIVFVVAFVDELDPDIDNFVSNRAAVVEVNAGDRAIYIQTRDTNTPLRVPPGELRCSVTAVDGGERVPLDRASGSTLDVNTDSYAREYSFDAPRDGRYRVICEGPEGINLAVGPDLSFGLFAPLIWAIVSFLVGVLAAGAIALVTAIRRSSHKQRLQREARQEQASGLA